MVVLLTAEQVCEKLNISVRFLRELTARKAVPYVKLSARCYRFDERAVEAAVARMTVRSSA